MNQSGLTNELTQTINPYYVNGNVFERDPRYYDQLIDTRRNRTPNKLIVSDQRGTVNGNSNVGGGYNSVPQPHITTTTTTTVVPPTNVIVTPPAGTVSYVQPDSE